MDTKGDEFTSLRMTQTRIKSDDFQAKERKGRNLALLLQSNCQGLFL
jgi:hypothetical protein